MLSEHVVFTSFVYREVFDCYFLKSFCEISRHRTISRLAHNLVAAMRLLLASCRSCSPLFDQIVVDIGVHVVNHLHFLIDITEVVVNSGCFLVGLILKHLSVVLVFVDFDLEQIVILMKLLGSGIAIKGEHLTVFSVVSLILVHVHGSTGFFI